MSEIRQAQVRNRRAKYGKLVSNSKWRCSITTYKNEKASQQFGNEKELLVHFEVLVQDLHEAYSRELDEAGRKFRGALEALRYRKQEALEALEALDKTEV